MYRQIRDGFGMIFGTDIVAQKAYSCVVIFYVKINKSRTTAEAIGKSMIGFSREMVESRYYNPIQMESGILLSEAYNIEYKI